MTLFDLKVKKTGNKDQVKEQDERQGNERKEEPALGDLSPLERGFRSLSWLFTPCNRLHDLTFVYITSKLGDLLLIP